MEVLNHEWVRFPVNDHADLSVHTCDTPQTLVPSTPAMFQKAGMLAPDGRCKTLDAAADGYVRAEAVGVMLMQALGQQQLAADGAASADQVPLAVLRGSAVSQDGRSSSLTGDHRVAVLQIALLKERLDAVTYCTSGLEAYHPRA